MKRILLALSLFAAVLCAACAVAEQPALTIGELRAQAEQGWHQTYDTARGESVRVDVDIDVPDAGAFPCYYAEDMKAVEGVPSAANDLAEAGEEAFVNQDGFFRVDWPNRSTQRQWKADAQETAESFGEPRALMLRFGGFDMDAAYSVNNPTTMNEALALMRDALERFYPEQDVALVPHWIHAHVEPGKYKKDEAAGDYVLTQADPDFEGVFFGYFDQAIDGIPVLGYGYQGFAGYKGAGKKGENLGQLGGVCITQGLKEIGSDELYRSLQFKLISVTEKIADDARLCGLDAVLATAGELIQAGQLRTVDSLRLGYVVWFDEAHTYKMMPTWVIEGELFESAQDGYSVPVTSLTDQSAEYASVYIDAQTGALINPFETGDARAYDAPELLK